MTTALPPIAVMERVVARRDPDFDGVFYVAVRTTGIFCRPSCPARPLPKNRPFLPTPRPAPPARHRPAGRVPAVQALQAAPGRRRGAGLARPLAGADRGRPGGPRAGQGTAG